MMYWGHAESSLDLTISPAEPLHQVSSSHFLFVAQGLANVSRATVQDLSSHCEEGLV